MEKSLVVTLLLTGLCEDVSCQTRTYFVVQTSKNWTEARRYCREKYTDLVTVRSLEENKQIQFVALAVSGFNQFWLELHRERENWQWSNGDAVSYTNWTAGSGALYCATADAGGSWGQSVCHDQKPFLCYNETSNITERYTLISTVKTWAEARQYCREHHTDLVSIKSASENEEIKKKAPTSPFWIGLFNDPWKWTDGGTSTFQNWGVSEPDNVLGKENCVLMYSLNNGKWEDWPCSFEFCFICYEEYNPTTSAPQTVPLSCLKQPCPSGQDCIADSCADPCHQYKVLDEPWRSTHFPVAVPSDPKCDRDLKGWYRFLADESARMPEACVPVYRCGTDAPMWLNGSHPLERDGIVIRQSCGQWNSKCCYFKTTIHVKACPGNYHVYKFQGTPGCNLAYCTESNFTTKALESTTERSTDTTERSTDTTERSTDTTERSTDTTERPTETQTSPEPGKGRRQVVRIEIKAPEGQDPEDPKIRDAILAELQEHFSKDTPKEGMTLRWIKKDGKIFHKLEEKEEEETETCSKP